MAEANPTPPASGIDTKALTDAITAAVGTAVGAAMKPLADQMAAIATAGAKPAAPAAGGNAEEAKPFTADDVKRMVAEAVTSAQQSTALSGQRQQYATEKLKDLPEVYRNQLGTDPAKWAAEEQGIRQRYQADFKLAGGKPADVGGRDGGGVPPAQTLDTSKMSPVQMATAALQQSAKVEQPAPKPS